MKQFGFIGAGNMGLPLIRAAAAMVGAEEVIFTAASEKTREKVQAMTGVKAAADNQTLAKECAYVIFAVKPQAAGRVFEEIAGVLNPDCTIVSVMAGVTTKTLTDALGPHPVIRLMPNTPAMVAEGMTTMCLSGLAEDSVQAKTIFSLCESVGKAAIIPEHLMSAAVCANGSSPAYVYLFIEALADSVVKYGIPRNLAYTLAAQTVLGSAKMVLETGMHPGALKDAVCSPGGTTIAAVEALEEYGLRNAVMKATDACFARSEELARKK